MAVACARRASLRSRPELSDQSPRLQEREADALHHEPREVEPELLVREGLKPLLALRSEVVLVPDNEVDRKQENDPAQDLRARAREPASAGAASVGPDAKDRLAAVVVVDTEGRVLSLVAHDIEGRLPLRAELVDVVDVRVQQRLCFGVTNIYIMSSST